MEAVETELAELDVAEFTREHAEDCKKPRARIYVIRIDRDVERVKESSLSGAEILQLVHKTPETHKLFQKFRGGRTEPVKPTDRVDFRAPGVERFQTIPLDTTEGAR